MHTNVPKPDDNATERDVGAEEQGSVEDRKPPTRLPPLGKFAPEDRSDKTELVEEVKEHLERRSL